MHQGTAKMENKKLQAALKYLEMKFSIIPTKADKKPYIKWEKYQTQRADKKQIEAWWKRWPNANPAVVTGEISGINVLDVDTAEGLENLNDNYLNDDLIIKTAVGFMFLKLEIPCLCDPGKINKS